MRSSMNTKHGARKVKTLKLISKNVNTRESEITEEIKNDREIDLEKIDKTFKNLIDNQFFLQNYEKIVSGNPQLRNAKDRENFDKRRK